MNYQTDQKVEFAKDMTKHFSLILCGLFLGIVAHAFYVGYVTGTLPTQQIGVRVP